jgi:hypothetical protein
MGYQYAITTPQGAQRMATKKQAQAVYEDKRCTIAIVMRLQRLMRGEPMGRGKPPTPNAIALGLLVAVAGQWIAPTPLGKAVVRYHESL